MKKETLSPFVDDESKIIKKELWTSKQRQSSSLHEISYRACFKGELPRFFIEKYSTEKDVVYDPFAGRGTTGVEAALLRRKVILNDVNPISRILSEPRFHIAYPIEIEKRLGEIKIEDANSDIDLSMFFHKETLNEILSIKTYLLNKTELDNIDKWIQLLVANRLTGHSSGFLSVYTMPPNQAVSQTRQVKINEQRNQKPEYRNTKNILIKKYKSLIRNISLIEKLDLEEANPIFISRDCALTPEIENNSVNLTVTSPPFLDIVDYYQDNWMRLWFNGINKNDINISIIKDISTWSNKMSDVFKELYRVTKPGGYVAFEVGEVKNGNIKLDTEVVKIATANDFVHEQTFINTQNFTKTSNIWGIKNNQNGTNTNRIVVLKK